MNTWSGITYNGDLAALLCEPCSVEFPFRNQLVEIDNLMTCMDRKCAQCGLRVADYLERKEIREAA